MAAKDTWLASQYLSVGTSDLEIVVESVGNPSMLSVFPTHVLVLKSQSSVLSAMLNSISADQGQTPRLNIKGNFSPRTLEYFLRFVYLRILPKLIHFEYLSELFEMSKVLEVFELHTECEKRLQSLLAISNVCQLYDIATKLNSESTIRVCRAYIGANSQAILNNDLHFFLSGGQSLMHVLCKVPKTLSKDHEWNKPTKEGEHQRKALLRWKKWMCCLKGAQWSETFNQALEMQPVENEVFPYGGMTDSDNWVPQLLMETSYSDLELLVDGGAKFPAHSLVLNKQSETFFLMWNEIRRKTDLNEHNVLQLELEDMDPRVTEYMLRFLYTHELPTEIPDVYLMKLFTVAHRFEISSLESRCSQLLVKKLNVLNCCQVLELSERFDSKLLFELCLKKILENPDKIFNNQLHFELSKHTLVKVLTGMKATGVVKDWSKWRCCLLGVNPDDEALSEMIQSLLNEAAGSSLAKKSDVDQSKRNSGPKMLLFSRKSLSNEKEQDGKNHEP